MKGMEDNILLLLFQYEEELDSMRRKLKECHREVDGLREANTRLERLLEQNGPRNVSQNSRAHIMAD